MEQQLKNAASLAKIIDAATTEFGEKGYDGASLNMLLSKHHISKGLLYHYFKNRDDLYLACVKRCFIQLCDTFQQVDGLPTLQQYMELRSRFFMEHPSYQRIFLDVLMNQPIHLSEAFIEIKKQLNEVNQKLFLAVIQSLPLADEITPEMALSSFTLIQNALHMQLFITGRKDHQITLGQYEEQTRNAVNILLYGLVRRSQS